MVDIAINSPAEIQRILAYQRKEVLQQTLDKILQEPPWNLLTPLIVSFTPEPFSATHYQLWEQYKEICEVSKGSRGRAKNWNQKKMQQNLPERDLLEKRK